MTSSKWEDTVGVTHKRNGEDMTAGYGNCVVKSKDCCLDEEERKSRR